MLVLDENVLKLGHTKISLDELPLLVKQFGEHFPFEEIEKIGERFRVNPDVDSGLAVIAGLCESAGPTGRRMYGPIITGNSPEHIFKCLQEGSAKLETGGGMPSELVRAMECVNRIRYLGQPTFASKILQMLHPEYCGVLDGWIAEQAGYPMDRMSFAMYSMTLQAAAKASDTQGIPSPSGLKNWRAADVDRAIHARIREARDTRT